MLPLSALAMLIFGCVVLYGGLGWCIHIAIMRERRHRRRQKNLES